MALFKSKREKQLWLLAFLVVMAIFATLFIGNPLIEALGNQQIQALLFLLGMALTAITLIAVGIGPKTARVIIVGALALVTVYVLLFLRLGLAERSHLIEYSVLAALVYSALNERFQAAKNSFFIGALTFGFAFGVGLIDELIQLFIPQRVFDPIDILFNGLVILLAILSILIMDFLKTRLNRAKT